MTELRPRVLVKLININRLTYKKGKQYQITKKAHSSNIWKYIQLYVRNIPRTNGSGRLNFFKCAKARQAKVKKERKKEKKSRVVIFIIRKLKIQDKKHLQAKGKHFIIAKLCN